MKNKYVTPEIKIIDLYSKDIITESKMQWDTNDEDTNYGGLNG